MLGTLSAVLASKGHTVHSISPTASVLEAVRKMNRERIGALLVCTEDVVVGIFTERDVLIRVVDESRDANATAVAEVMTRELVVVKPSMTVEEAMAVVSERRCRHLPVMDGPQLMGLVSIGDLTRWVSRNQDIHIQDLVNFITDRYPR